MPRFVLTARSHMAHPGDLDKIVGLHDVTLIDKINQRAALIEAPIALLEEMRQSLPEWLIEEEQLHQRPDLKPPTVLPRPDK
jgi:hypothetical protein